MVGTQLGHYRIIERIGAGGMGEVYRARDERLDRDIALKVLPAASFADETARARLLREARSAAALNHPNICTIHEVGEANRQAYIAMEFVEGRPLSDCVQPQALPAESAMRYGSQIASALAHAHDRHIVHRDLKCANVVITPDARAKVLDFGLAKRQAGEELSEATTQSHAPLTQAGAAVGTLAYMSPEQLRGEPADARSDIWALGVMLYEMVAGMRPFRGQTGFQLSAAILNQSMPPLPAKVPLELCAVIERCLVKEPGQRYQRASEVHAALEAIQSGQAARWPAVRYAVARFRWLFVAAALVLLAVLAAGLDVAGLRSRLTGSPAAPRIESLAVLPVENLTGDPEQEYFADGMTEELITEFSRVRAFKRVIPRTSVMRYKGAGRPLREIAAELGVDAVVEASLLQAQGQVRATVRLIEGSTEQNLWADRYARESADVPLMYSQVVSAVTQQLHVVLTSSEQARLAAARPVNPEAYDALLRGRFHMRTLSPQGFQTALEYFQLALQKDPNFALAHGAIGMVALSRAHMGFVSPREVASQAREDVQRALALDEAQPDLHDFMAGVHLYLEWDWPAAAREFRRERELNPQNWGCTAALYTDYLLVMGRQEEALADIRRCLQANPLDFWVEAAFGGRLLRVRRFEEGIPWLQKAVGREPNLALGYSYLWFAHHHQERYGEALDAARKFFVLKGQGAVAEAMTRGQAEAGYAGAMRRGAERLEALAKQTFVREPASLGYTLSQVIRRKHWTGWRKLTSNKIAG